MDNYFQICHNKLTFSSFIYNLLINTIIAVFLSAINVGSGFVVNLIFSQCIGISIFFTNFIVINFFRTVKNIGLSLPFVIVNASVIIGAIVGTIFGFLTTGISPGFFLREQFSFFAQTIFIGLLFGSLLSYVFISLRKISEEKIMRLEEENKLIESEIKLLRSQMKPHFSTLSTVITLIDADPEKARRMLEALSSSFRPSFSTVGEQNCGSVPGVRRD